MEDGIQLLIQVLAAAGIVGLGAGLIKLAQAKSVHILVHTLDELVAMLTGVRHDISGFHDAEERRHQDRMKGIAEEREERRTALADMIGGIREEMVADRETREHILGEVSPYLKERAAEMGERRNGAEPPSSRGRPHPMSDAARTQKILDLWPAISQDPPTPLQVLQVKELVALVPWPDDGMLSAQIHKVVDGAFPDSIRAMIWGAEVHARLVFAWVAEKKKDGSWGDGLLEDDYPDKDDLLQVLDVLEEGYGVEIGDELPWYQLLQAVHTVYHFYEDGKLRENGDTKAEGEGENNDPDIN